MLNANYMKARLEPHYPGAVRRREGPRRARADLRPASVQGSARASTRQDVAKRLMDYGFHAPTVSFPVPGTLMVEPTESEPKEELDRFCDAMIAIRGEIRPWPTARADRADNVLKNAPHTAEDVTADDWPHAVFARAGRLSGAGAAAPQVLAAGVAHRQSVRRSQSDVRVPADRSVRLRSEAAEGQGSGRRTGVREGFRRRLSSIVLASLNASSSRLVTGPACRHRSPCRSPRPPA